MRWRIPHIISMVLRTQEADVTASVMTERPMKLYVDLCSVRFFDFFVVVVVLGLDMGSSIW